MGCWYCGCTKPPQQPRRWMHLRAVGPGAASWLVRRVCLPCFAALKQRSDAGQDAAPVPLAA